MVLVKVIYRDQVWIEAVTLEYLHSLEFYPTPRELTWVDSKNRVHRLISTPVLSSRDINFCPENFSTS